MKEDKLDLIRMSRFDEDDLQDEETPQQPPEQEAEKPKKRKKGCLFRFITFIFVVLFSACVCSCVYVYSLVESIPRKELDEANLGITTNDYHAVKNIALLGIDARKDTDIGRSDAVVVLTVDKEHKKMKLTSIARDSYVEIDSHGMDKLTHAYAYGKSQLAVKTLNQNFSLEITDYITMNFFDFVEVIDYIGGVEVEVDEKELYEINNNILPYLDEMKIEAEPIKSHGKQILSGAQALCYARIRHIDSDIIRGNRQKEIISAVFEKMKTIEKTKLPKIAKDILSNCETSLSTKEIFEIGLFMLANGAEFESLSIPNENITAEGKTISGKWCYEIDLDEAKREIYDFIFEQNNYSVNKKEKDK